MIVTVSASGVVVRDADDCTRLHLETTLDEARLRKALDATDTGTLGAGGTAVLDLAVLRSRAVLQAKAPDWKQRWTALVDAAEHQGWLSEDGRSVQVHVERPA